MPLFLGLVVGVSTLGTPQSNRLIITRNLQAGSDKACQLVRMKQADNAQLQQAVYEPLAADMLIQMQRIFAQKIGSPPPAGRQTTYLGKGAEEPLTPPVTSTEITAPNETMIANAAAAVADTIADNYRAAYSQKYHEAPMPSPYQESENAKDGKKAKVSDDIRHYCGQLAEMGITELFPLHQTSNRSDAP